MPSDIYRVYIRFGKTNYVRFIASGSGYACSSDGLRLFNWIRDPANITRLQDRLQHVYERDENELMPLLSSIMRNGRGHMRPDRISQQRRGAMLAAMKRIRADFACVQTSVDTLDAISKAKGITIIPRVSPRKRSDGPGW
ncbi:hypothetical protein NPX13_g250 [Xylaria arbuscula]|uniref:Uncharacterized protein n=1 Tax=Xylaria arbuscula TaxID=114810 RepID=A0A9W8NN70_9PEZI|nr:hypothetical protein NPX13_g250 [Xylaria arbuscula]